MSYRVEELASRVGVGVDTIRYYQGLGLLAPPRRQGRVALYEEAHLERLRRIRTLSDRGFKLAQIRKLLAGPANGDAELLDALYEQELGEGRTWTRAELAAEAGLPEPLLEAAERARLIQPLRVEGAPRYTEADLGMARAALALLGSGMPLPALVALAVEHARHVEDVAERAIDLFAEHVRRRPDGTPEAPERVTELFRLLLPQVTRLVALHFQRTVVTRALARLSEEGEDGLLRDALAGTDEPGLEVSVTWR